MVCKQHWRAGVDFRRISASGRLLLCSQWLAAKGMCTALARDHAPRPSALASKQAASATLAATKATP
eukprot:192823-Pleurochrysis_carterae.AAC.1